MRDTYNKSQQLSLYFIDILRAYTTYLEKRILIDDKTFIVRRNYNWTEWIQSILLV